MAPVIWGFDLGDMRWSAFSSRNMFDRKWHLRAERFVIYQLAMLVSLAAESTATYSLSKYQKLSRHIREHASTGPDVAIAYVDDILNAEIATICFCVFVATLFGADFFFLLFFPRRRYPSWYRMARAALAIIISAGMLASAIASTVIVARHSAYLANIPPVEAQILVILYYRPPLKYSKWAVNIAYVVLLWIGTFFTFWSTAIMFVASAHDEKYGTAPKGDVVQDGTAKHTPGSDSETPMTQL